MKAMKILTILIVAPGLMVWLPSVSQAVLMGTAFTYQGRLIDANSTADGLYDFQFKIFDDPNVIIGNQVGNDINVPDVDVIDGYFTVQLDFGSSIFTGDARWLEIGVRDYDPCDVNAYTGLIPRQEMTPSPYAIYAWNAKDANTVDGYTAGNSSGQVAVSNGLVCINLNADRLDGQEASAFASSGHNHDAAYINDSSGEINTASDFAFAASTFISNLSADFLDGQHGSYYRNASNLNVGTIPEARLPQNAIDGSEIQDNSLGQADIATSGVGSAEIANGSVTASDMADGATLGEILDDDGSGSGLDADLLDGQHGSYYRNASNLNAGTIAEARLPQNAIDSSEIQDNSLTASDIATDGVGAAEIAAGAVGTSEIANNSITTADIATDGVGASEIAANAVGDSEVAQNSSVVRQIYGSLNSGQSRDFTFRSGTMVTIYMHKNNTTDATVTLWGLELPGASRFIYHFINDGVLGKGMTYTNNSNVTLVDNGYARIRTMGTYDTLRIYCYTGWIDYAVIYLPKP